MAGIVSKVLDSEILDSDLVSKVLVCHLHRPIDIFNTNDPQIQVILQFLKFVRQQPGFVSGSWGYAREEPSTFVIFLQLDKSTENINGWYEKLRWPERSSADDLGPENV